MWKTINPGNCSKNNILTTCIYTEKLSTIFSVRCIDQYCLFLISNQHVQLHANKEKKTQVWFIKNRETNKDLKQCSALVDS